MLMESLSRYLTQVNRRGRSQGRAVSFSKDGDESWSADSIDAALKIEAAQCQANLLRLTRKPSDDRDRLLYSEPSGPSNQLLRFRKNHPITALAERSRKTYLARNLGLLTTSAVKPVPGARQIPNIFRIALTLTAASTGPDHLM